MWKVNVINLCIRLQHGDQKTSKEGGATEGKEHFGSTYLEKPLQVFSKAQSLEADPGAMLSEGF